MNRWEDLEYNAETGVLRNARLDRKLGTRVNGRMLVRVEGKLLSMTRVVWFLHHGEWPKHKVCARNGDNTDLRMCNLMDGHPAYAKCVYEFMGKWAVLIDEDLVGTYDTKEQAERVLEDELLRRR